MPRKKSVPVEEQDMNPEALGLPEAEATESSDGFPEGPTEPGEEEMGPPPADGMVPSQNDAAVGDGEAPTFEGLSDPPPEEDGERHEAPAVPEETEGAGTLPSDPPPDLLPEDGSPHEDSAMPEGTEEDGAAAVPEGLPGEDVRAVEGADPLPAVIPEDA